MRPLQGVPDGVPVTHDLALDVQHEQMEPHPHAGFTSSRELAGEG